MHPGICQDLNLNNQLLKTHAGQTKVAEASKDGDRKCPGRIRHVAIISHYFSLVFILGHPETQLDCGADVTTMLLLLDHLPNILLAFKSL